MDGAEQVSTGYKVAVVVGVDGVITGAAAAAAAAAAGVGAAEVVAAGVAVTAACACAKAVADDPAKAAAVG